MNWNLILPSTVIAAILSSLIAYLVYRAQKKYDYKIDHKRYILKKRQDAYDRLLAVLTVLSDRVVSLETNKPILKIFLAENAGINPLAEFSKEVAAATSESFWFSDNMLNEVKILNDFLTACMIELRNDKWSLKAMEEIGVQVYPQIEQLRRDIYFTYFEDVKNLDDIEKFISKKQHY